MEKMGLNEIREKYLSFYETKGHLRLPSFSLVPKNDPSILLINAGMTPMKPYFSGAEKPPRTRVTTCQKCIRTPDIESVGHTARHGTFFEMLGNFSFGDYFKADAITWAWEFVTEVLRLPEERLYVTVYHEDDEAYDFWHHQIGLAPNRIFRMGKKDNFWEHGTGPCGPCSEIFFDRGPEYGCDRPDCNVGCDCDRYVEFWNLVFTQFDRQEDGSYLPLASKNIDTGGGLERFACIMQGVDSLFEVDTVRRLLDTVCTRAKVHYGQNRDQDVAIRVITDHIRSTTMMISDGVLPSNEGRGYVLRRLLRRAARYGKLLGVEGLFLHELVPVVISESCGAYPELREREDSILRVVETEEKRFEKTIRQGSALLDGYVEELKSRSQLILPGDWAFKLHDTYGFPLDLTREIAAEQGLQVDEEGFRQNMQKQKDEARAAMKAKAGSAWSGDLLPEGVDHDRVTEFLGYDQLEAEAEVLSLIGEEEGEAVLLERAGVDDAFLLITDRTPFYATGGGQNGDRGSARGPRGLELQILDTTKNPEGIFLHHCRVTAGTLQPGDHIELLVDGENRMDTARNHSTTHLLHKALRTILGDHVTQAGSSVDADRLRFDFHHMQACTAGELEQVEQLVRESILRDLPVVTEVLTMDEAKSRGAMALFDEKYGDRVRVVTMGDFSCELCGGTHLQRTSQVGLFHIVSEGSVASGIRRIEAITGRAALAWMQGMQQQIQGLTEALHAKPEQLLDRVQSLQQENRDLQKELQVLKSEQARQQASGLLDQAFAHKNLRFLVAEVQADSSETLRDLAEGLRSQLGQGLVLLGSRLGEKLGFVAMATPEAVATGFAAGALVRVAAQCSGGGGGGRPDMAQAGGKDVAALGRALQAVREEIQKT